MVAANKNAIEPWYPSGKVEVGITMLQINTDILCLS